MKLLFASCFLVITFQACPLFSQVIPQKIDLKNNGISLDASFYRANIGTEAPAVILLHGFPGNQSSPLGLAEKLNREGLNVLVFNYQGSYLSEGSFSFDNCIRNVDAAFEFLVKPEHSANYKIDTSQIFVCGYSFGGTIAIESGFYNDKIRNIIAIGNDDHSVSIRKAASDTVFRKNYIEFVGRSFSPSGPFRGDLKSLFVEMSKIVDRYDLVKNAEKLKGKNVLFIVGWKDRTSLMENNTLPLYRKLTETNIANVRIAGFDDDHRFTSTGDEIVKTIIGWIKSL